MVEIFLSPSASWCSAKHTVDTQMNLNWYINDYDGNEKPQGFNLRQILSGFMARILSSSCEQICISFPTPPPQQSEIFAWNEKNQEAAKNALSICSTVQLLVEFPKSHFFMSVNS